MDTIAIHLLVEYQGCDRALLDDQERLEPLMRRAASEAGATVVAAAFHRFAPQGVSGVVVIEESHLSLHTWPETGYCAIDFYTCGECDPMAAHRFLAGALGAERFELMSIDRGLHAARAMRVHRHESGVVDTPRSAVPASASDV